MRFHVNKPTKLEILLALGMAFVLPAVTYLGVKQFQENAAVDAAATKAEEASKSSASVNRRLDQLIIKVTDRMAAVEDRADKAMEWAKAAMAAKPGDKENDHAAAPDTSAAQKEALPENRNAKDAPTATAAEDRGRPCTSADFDEGALKASPPRLHRIHPCGEPAAPK